MLRKRIIESLPSSVQVVEFSPGEFKPIFVAAKNIEKVVIGYSPKTAANDRCSKKGPPYYMVGGRPYYKLSDLEAHFGANPVETTQ